MTRQPDLTGFYDLHIHAAPDNVPRLQDDIELVRAAAAAGMSGIMLKSHCTQTADRAALAQKYVGTSIRVWGGLALNDPVGGLNPAAVETAIALGAREVWMPTRNTANENRRAGHAGGLTIFDGDGVLLPVVHEILSLLAQADLILGTGHLSPAETLTLVPVARLAGVRRILITHPAAPFTDFTLEQQRTLRDLDCHFERCWVFTTDVVRQQGNYVSPARILNDIQEIGWETTVLGTDYGQVNNPPPVDGLRAFVAACLGAGFTEAQVQRMGSLNPAALVEV